ncbi:methyltransferase domain-containing protein [Pedobacter lithocola]|uniref:Methyltransferase domain-containing protein n=1 Tax=Pedobacter lithocola TaxID=1908239 RepID=A0ABV8P9K2_9SPHI
MLATGFEIGKERAEFGIRNLNLQIFTKSEDITGQPFNFIFSSHVIEHLPDIKMFINLCFKLLDKNGFLILLSPNGSNDFKKANPQNFHLFWGQVHPNMISADFYSTIFKHYPYFISSSPYNIRQLNSWNQTEKIISLTGGEELLCIVKKK